MPNNQIMLISTEKCLTNVELVGCSPGRVEEINVNINSHRALHKNLPQNIILNNLINKYNYKDY